MANERYNAPGRDIARKQTLEALDQPWSSFCTADGRKLLIDAINYYYGQRSRRRRATPTPMARLPGSTRSRPGRRRTTVASSARRAKSSAAATSSSTNCASRRARMVAELVKGERVSGKPCTA